MKDFRELKVWEKSHQLALAVYRATAKFPTEELYGLTSEVRCSSVSIPTNIAEGCGRGSHADFAHFLQIAMGFARETEYQLLLSLDPGFVLQDEYSKLQASVQEVKRTISSLLKTLHSTSRTPVAES